MKITKIESQKNKNRVNIYLDDKFAFGINLEVVYKYKLKKDMELKQEYIKNILKAEEQNKAKNYSFDLISFKWRTEKEIRDKLTKKEYNQEVIEETITLLKNQNLINDERFAKSYVKDKTNIKKLGAYRIKYELCKKGVSQTIIEKVIQKYCNNENEFERAMNLASKKISSYKKDDKKATYRKLGGYLQRRGYSYECISKVLKKLVK